MGKKMKKRSGRPVTSVGQLHVDLRRALWRPEFRKNLGSLEEALGEVECAALLLQEITGKAEDLRIKIFQMNVQPRGMTHLVTQMAAIDVFIRMLEEHQELLTVNTYLFDS